MNTIALRRRFAGWLTIALAVALLPGCSLFRTQPPTGSQGQANAGSVDDPDLIWRDDFDSPGAPDSTQWLTDVGAGWGDGGVQTFTQDPSNVTVVDGQLRITAVAAADSSVTSARVSTRGLSEMTDGTLQARVRFPARVGVLASFSLVATDAGDSKQAATGEVDVAQATADAKKYYTTLSGPKAVDASQQWRISTSFTPSGPVDVGFHTYAVQKTEGQLAFAVDNVVTAIVKKTDLPAENTWVFDKPFYIVFEIAVGGAIVGAPDASTQFPVQLAVDWISLSRRVQQ